MGYRIHINDSSSAWSERSDGSVKQALRRQAELVEGITASPAFVSTYGQAVSDEIRRLARNVREGKLEAISELMSYASKCGRISALPSSIAVLQHYVQRFRAAVKCGEEESF